MLRTAQKVPAGDWVEEGDPRAELPMQFRQGWRPLVAVLEGMLREHPLGTRVRASFEVLDETGREE